MTEQEFLNSLRESLLGSLPDQEINENIRYYRDYISQESVSKSEEVVIGELGDPRLIARTIIETYQRAHGTQTYSKRVEYEEEEDTERFHPNRARTFRLSGKAAGIITLIILLLILGVVIFLGGIILSVVLRFLLPIIGVIMIVVMIKRLIEK